MKPPIISTQHPLPFCNLEHRRFEDLCLRIAISKYGLQYPKHHGRTGADAGRDIEGWVEREGKIIEIAIQCKRYEKISGSILIETFATFLKNFPNFEGEFWIMTSANASQKARNELSVAALEKKLTCDLIDRSTLESTVRSLPNLMEEFFSTPSSFTQNYLKETLFNCIKVIQLFEVEFLRELYRSFSGNFPLIMERQRIMGDLLNTSITDLKSEFAKFPNKIEGLKKIEQTAKSLISNYRMYGQTSEDGSYFWGKDEAVKARDESSDIRHQFQEACQNLIIELKRRVHISQ